MSSTDYNRSDLNDIQPHANSNPIQRLSPEILAEIFTFCLPHVPKELWRVKHISSRKAPLLLCSVCSSWRSLAISTPRLWQTLHLGTCDRIFSIDTESLTSGIRTWLDRSRALPLSICAGFSNVDPTGISDKATKCRLILEILSQESSRWESLGLSLWSTPPHLGILPILHTFHCSASPNAPIPFTAAPRLKKLHFVSLPNLTSTSVIPWDQLVELTIQKTQTISMVVEVIQRCPRLESLLLRVKEDNEDGSLTFRSITQHNTLWRLHLYMEGYINAATDRLTLPALTDLSLRVHQSISEVEAKFTCSQLVDFFTRSNCELHEFELRCYGFGPGELLEYLSHRSCQTLTHLFIQQFDNPEPSPRMVDRELLIRLTYSDADDVPLCPKLTFLRLDCCYRSNESFPDLLGRMIQSRCFGRAPDAQLRSLRLCNCHHYTISREDCESLLFAKSNSGLELRYPIQLFR